MELEALGSRPVSEIMRTEVVTLAPRERLDLTQDVMNLGRVRHMPVVDEKRLVGIVSNRDLLEASLSKALDFDARSRRAFLRAVEVEEVMARDVVTVAPDTTLGEAARILVRRQLGCLPVVGPDGALLGLVTETDLLTAAFLTDGEDAATAKASARSELAQWIGHELEDLRRVRDELHLQAHLARAEVRDRWQSLESIFQELERRAKRTAQAAGEPLRELESDARKLVGDLREGYRRIRDTF